MKTTLALLLAIIAMQLNCGTIAAKKTDISQLVGDFPNNLKKGIYHA